MSRFTVRWNCNSPRDAVTPTTLFHIRFNSLATYSKQPCQIHLRLKQYALHLKSQLAQDNHVCGVGFALAVFGTALFFLYTSSAVILLKQ